MFLTTLAVRGLYSFLLIFFSVHEDVDLLLSDLVDENAATYMYKEAVHKLPLGQKKKHEGLME